MLKRFSAVLAAAGAILAGCEREAPRETARPAAPPIAAQAERQIEKAGAALDDATITAKIKTALLAEPGVKGMAIDVDTSNNIVSLNGAVASDAAKTRAAEIARKVEGVKEVRNNLTVKPGS